MSNLKQMLFKVFISCHLILLQVSGALCANEPRIVGGIPTTIDKVQYLVQIWRDGNFHCGGSALSQFYILSAAHCVDNTYPAQLLVVAAASSRTDFGIRSAVSNFMVPANFNRMTLDMDVSVLKLTTGIAGPLIRYATFYQQGWKPGNLLELYGWGAQGENGARPNQLHTTTVTVMEKRLCEQMYISRMRITPSMFCAYRQGSNSCHGDSGGPAIINGQVAGIVSWGFGCARPDSPAVYTDVRKVSTFITYAMQRM